MRSLTALLAVVTILLGLVIFAIGAVHDGTSGMVIGALFAAAGGGRLWLMRRRLG